METDTPPRSAGLRFLVAESEPREARDRRRASVGRSSGETYVETLVDMAPGASCRIVRPAEPDAGLSPRGCHG